MTKAEMLKSDSNEIKNEIIENSIKTRKRCLRELSRNDSQTPHKKTKIENTNYIKQCSKKFNLLRSKWKEIRNLNNNRISRVQQNSSTNSTKIFNKSNSTSTFSKKTLISESDFSTTSNKFNFANSNNQSNQYRNHHKTRHRGNSRISPQRALSTRNSDSFEAFRTLKQSIFKQAKFLRDFEKTMITHDRAKLPKTNREAVICNARLDTDTKSQAKNKQSKTVSQKISVKNIPKENTKPTENTQNCCSHNEVCDCMAYSDTCCDSCCCLCRHPCDPPCDCFSPCQSSCPCSPHCSCPQPCHCPHPYPHHCPSSCSCPHPYPHPCPSSCSCPHPYPPPCPHPYPCPYPCPSSCHCPHPCSHPCYPPCCCHSCCSEGSCMCFCPDDCCCCCCSPNCIGDFNCDPKQLEKLKECVDSLISKTTNNEKENSPAQNNDKTNDEKKTEDKTTTNKTETNPIDSTTSFAMTDKQKAMQSKKYKSNARGNFGKKAPKSNFRVLTLLEKIQNSKQIPFEEKKYLLDVLNLDEESKDLLEEKMLNFSEILKMVTDTRQKVVSGVLDRTTIEPQKLGKNKLEKMRLKELRRDKSGSARRITSSFGESNKENTNLPSHINSKNFFKKVGFHSHLSLEDKKYKLPKKKKLSELLSDESLSSSSSSLDSTSNSSDLSESVSNFSEVSSNGNNKNNKSKLKKKMAKLFKSNARLSQQVKESLENNKNLLKQNLELLACGNSPMTNKLNENSDTSTILGEINQSSNQELQAQNFYLNQLRQNLKNATINNKKNYCNPQNNFKPQSIPWPNQYNSSRQDFTKSRSLSTGANREKPVQINYIILTDPKQCQSLLKKSSSLSGLENIKKMATKEQSSGSKNVHVITCPSNMHSILSNSYTDEVKSFELPQNKILKYLNELKNKDTKKLRYDVQPPSKCYRKDSGRFILEETSSLASEMMTSNLRCKKPIIAIYPSENFSSKTSEIQSENYSFKDSECSRTTCSLRVYPKTKLLSCRYQLPKRIKKQKFKPRIIYDDDKIDVQKQLLENKQETLKTLKRDIKSRLEQIVGIISSPHRNNHGSNMKRFAPKHQTKQNSSMRDLDSDSSFDTDKGSEMLVEILNGNKGRKAIKRWDSGSRGRHRDSICNGEDYESDFSLFQVENKINKINNTKNEIIRRLAKKLLQSKKERKNSNLIRNGDRSNSPCRLYDVQYGKGENFNNCKKPFFENEKTNIKNLLRKQNLKRTIRPAQSQSVSTICASDFGRFLRKKKLKTAKPQFSRESYSIYGNDSEITESEYTEILSELLESSQESSDTSLYEPVNSLYEPVIRLKKNHFNNYFPLNNGVSGVKSNRPCSILKKNGGKKNVPKISVKYCNNLESIRRI